MAAASAWSLSSAFQISASAFFAPAGGLGQRVEHVADLVNSKLRQAWQETDHDIALEQLTALALELDRPHPGAAASLREGMEETLTVIRLGVTGKLKQSRRTRASRWCATRRHVKGENGRTTLIRAGWKIRPRADAAARRSWGQSRRGIARWRREQPRQRSGRAALPDARVRASKTERQSESKAVVEAS